MFDDNFAEVEVRQIHGPEVCPRPCADCPDARHHWIEQSLDFDDEQDRADFTEDHPGLEPTEDLLLAHYACKHCEAVAVPGDEEGLE